MEGFKRFSPDPEDSACFPALEDLQNQGDMNEG